ncbi:MAG: DUF305 domain-containing protein [Thermoleophilia bacterium]|nr:DUF305 domain-containing protein [Thermoleophilia bacterium]
MGIVFAVSMDPGDSSSDVDGAFVSQMIPHHESAIEMAELAKEKGQHPEIIQLANNIVGSQSSEVESLNGMHDRLSGDSMMNEDSGDLGMDESMMGMNVDMETLGTAKPFDREFIDQMIPHHQGAIRMARVELQDGEDQELKDLAMQIVNAQAAEIEDMNRWRTEWYGGPSPARGVPGLDETSSGDSMGHMDQ